MEENTGKKQCPFCGMEINANAKKCRFCNNWLDEEIECPFCAEKIKASAKKCRFCGEWLPQAEEKTDKSKPNKNFEILKNLPDKNKIFLFAGIIAAIVLLSGIIWKLFFFIPSCFDKTILSQLETKIRNDYDNIQTLTFDKDSAAKLSKAEKGYSCRISADVDDSSLSMEYTYKKISFNEYNFTTKVILPDCYDGTIKKILTNLIKDSDYLNFRNTVSSVNIEKATVENFDKDIPKYTCEADITVTAKPGRAFVKNSWDTADADNELKCKVRYESLFCGNGYTTCAGLNKITNCEYVEE